MLKTALGNIKVTLNGEECEYKKVQLENVDKRFSVDERYKLAVNIPDRDDTGIVIECTLENIRSDNTRFCIESGEKLALVSFYYNNLKLSMGVEDEIKGVKCEYLSNGLRVTIQYPQKINQVIFGIAWLTIDDEKREDIYSWFAADPTLF